MENVGGQALVEGVMMISNEKVAMAVRKKNKIKVKVEKRLNFARKVKNIFLLRGVAALIEMLYTGTRALTWSSNESLEKDEKITKGELTFTLIFSFLFGILIFILLPFYAAKFISKNHFIFNLIEGILRIFIFLIYVLLIGKSKEIRRIYQYHGAEHMAVHCYEHKEKLNVNNVNKYSTLHPRCGTAFIFLVLIISILLFSLIWSENWLIKFFFRILLIPVIAGISYELLKFSSKHQNNTFFKALIKPGLWFQKITTKKPDKKQIEVAIKSLEAAVK